MLNPKILPPENLDSEPDAITPGETEFFFGHNRPEEDGETLLAFEDLPEAVQRQIQEKRKQNQMIRIQSNQVPQATSQTPRGVTFLKPMHATKEGVKAIIYKVTVAESEGGPKGMKADNYGNPYVVYFNIDGLKYSKGFKPTSDNLASLVSVLGADESKWLKKSVTVFRVVDEENSERLAFGK